MLISGLGGRLDLDFLGPLPDNVNVFAWAPQLTVLEHADCSINHGGIHTINECLHFQVPMLVYSGKRSDQNGCAARVAFHGIGLMADKDRDDVPAIREKIERVLTDPVYKERLAAMYRHYQRTRTEKRIEKIVEKYMPVIS